MTYRDVDIIDAVEDYMFGSQNLDLIGYRTQSLERDLAYKDIFMWSMRRVCALGRMEKSKVLDIGCGFGWQALAVSMIGRNQVTALDILPSMIDGVRDCIASLAAKNKYEFNITPKVGDICEVDLPTHSFDAIYSMEAIEHVHDVGLMFDNCARLLKPGGRIVLLNDCNILNRHTKNGLEVTFNKRETSWDWANYLRSIRPIEHRDARPFQVMREEIIQAANPDITTDDVERLVWCTAGMLKPDIEKLAKDYKPGDSLPPRRKVDWCRNPETGEFAERLFDPYELAEMFKERGMSAMVLHCFRRIPLRFLNNIQFRPVNHILFNRKPEFAIVASAPH
jgi:SAM-dependent methyltransferase